MIGDVARKLIRAKQHGDDASSCTVIAQHHHHDAQQVEGCLVPFAVHREPSWASLVSSEFRSHLVWIAKKDALRQDMFLIGHVSIQPLVKTQSQPTTPMVCMIWTMMCWLQVLISITTNM
jgi:hypothetical protein